ncbi:Plastid transcriptionally active 2 isoform 1 [Hibiscus syriacus]|uniref:hydroxyisourate hydrolase n=1 Tax=Hibiscus syriacus TaxID=106335 RepID=A0A6A2ZC73_HIBSY|nr:Plastid transcriptionally active 2 isoform 1 [Hibiscus syriacus]
MEEIKVDEKEVLACCGSTQFAKQMAMIGESPSSQTTSAKWSKGEQSTALATATDVGLGNYPTGMLGIGKNLDMYSDMCAGRSAAEILGELKNRYSNRPIVELEIASQEQMKHVTATLEGLPAKALQVQARTRPPITTHVLDVSKGCPAAGIEVRLEMWKGSQPHPSFGETDTGRWVLEGSSTTDRDGRSGQLMSMVDALSPGVYRISFNTGKYNPGGFFPYVSIVFEIKESQTLEHFHVPLLLSPFSFSTYRGS